MTDQLSLLEDEGELEVFGLDQYQELAASTSAYPDAAALVYPTLGLAGEAGEFANKVKKIIRGDKGNTGTLIMTADQREALIDELGDVMWYVAAVATDLDVSLADVAERNIEKLFDRARRKVLKGDGDNR